MMKCLFYFRTICICLLMAYGFQTKGQSDSTQTDSTRVRRGKFIVIPALSSTPETSLRFSAIPIYYFRFPNSLEGTQLSIIRLPMSYTLNNQFSVRLSYDIFMSSNRHIYRGSVQWFSFPLLFYGLGTDVEDSDEEIYTTKTFGFDFTYLKKIWRHSYAGVRYLMFDSNITETEQNGLLEQDGLIPGNNGGRVSGLGIVGRIDNRDNFFNASKGPFFQTSLLFYGDQIGSDFTYTSLQMDFRDYWKIRKKSILAFRLVLENNWGDPSFETMALLGGENILRGHYLGRFRDKALWSSQVEYRFPLGRESWIEDREKPPFWERWGLIGFLGAGNVSSTLSRPDFGNTKIGGGFGLRYLAFPRENINLRLDVGFGTQKPWGIYISVREAF